MSRLAVIGTFYRRPWAIPRISDALRVATRQPDEVWALWEDESDFDGLRHVAPGAILKQIVPEEGQNPLSAKTNHALDHSTADYFVYLTDDSLPDPRKYEVMARALDENPDWGAVYCAQDYGVATGPEDWLAGGTHENTRIAGGPEGDPFCRVDHTQVMHRRTVARWPMDRGSVKLSDAHFFRALVGDLGPLMPIGEVLDWTRQLPGGLSR